jgi:hypothetical protein
LLKPANLDRLKAEVGAARKQESRELSWDYPYYFFGEEPPSRASAPAAAGKRRKDR